MKKKKRTPEQNKRTKSMLLLLAMTSILFLYNWINDAIGNAHVMPKTEKYALQQLAGEIIDTPEEIRLLAEQTGLNEKVIMKMLWENRGEELAEIQDIYFAPISIEELQTTPLTISEWLSEECEQDIGGMPLVDIQNGDILITKNSRFLGWRNGHAGLVVDAEKGLVLEALMLGSPSKLCSIKRWEKYPSFQVLRLKEETTSEGSSSAQQGRTLYVGDVVPENKLATATKVAAYAAENLANIPYHLLADVLKSPKADELAIPTGTHCAHLVWYAYMQFGIDLDSDGGWIVTPTDIANSPYLEVVQSYGY